MKPKTSLEYNITALSATLDSITEKQQIWAQKKIFLNWGVISRNKFHCLECSYVWKEESNKPINPKTIHCPSCLKKLKIFEYNQVYFKEIEYWSVVTVTENFQVVRILCSYKHMKKNQVPHYAHFEVMQHWITPLGEVRTLSKSTNAFAQAFDSWKMYTNLEIRPKGFQKTNKFYINPYRIYPVRQTLPIIKRNGFKYSFHNIAPQILFTAILKDSYAETLLKAKQIKLLSYYLGATQQRIKENWQAVKMVLKTNYYIKDYNLWEDYIALLKYFKKDLCNSAIVCPKCLNESHNRLVAKKREIQRKLKMEQMRHEIAEAQKRYAKEKKHFFGLAFSYGNLKISVIENVRHFMEEGDLLQHCVFTNEYYTKKDSLLFSARIANTPIETVEVSLSKMEIIQSRGIKNKASKHHSQILKLINKNLYQISGRMNKNKAVRV